MRKKKLQKHFSGYFFENKGEYPKLPATDIFSIEGLQDRNETFKAWSKENHQLVRVLGVYHHQAYGNNDLLFSWGKSSRGQLGDSNKIFVNIDAFVNSQNYKGNNKERFSLSYILRMQNHWFIHVALKSYLDLLKEEVNSIRKSVYLDLGHRRRGLDKNISSYKTVRLSLAALERLKIELGDGDFYLAGTIYEDYDLSQFEVRKETASLLKDATENALFRIGELYKHMHFVNDTFSDYISLAHLQQSFKLERVALYIAVAALIISVASSIISK